MGKLEYPNSDIEAELANSLKKRVTEREIRSGKQTLHELPANYTPPSMPKESQPIVVSKRIVIIIIAACLLIVVGAVALKYHQKHGVQSGTDIDMQLIMGTNVKRNLDGGDWATLSLPSDLVENDLLKTGSDRRNVIAFPDGTTIRLDYASTIKISKVESMGQGTANNGSGAEEAYNIVVTLHKGALYVDEHGDSKVIVETKFARFEPVGTRFGVTQIERKDLTEQSLVNVTEGSVLMRHLDDPNSKVIVTAGKQAAATAQSLIKPRKEEKNDWMAWNNKWRDIRSIPGIKNAKLRKGDIDTNEHNGPSYNAVDESGIDYDQTPSRNGMPTRSGGSSGNGMPTRSGGSSDNGMPTRSGGSSDNGMPMRSGGSSDNGMPIRNSNPSDSGPAPVSAEPSRAENHVEREAREAREREEAERKRAFEERRRQQEKAREEAKVRDDIQQQYRKAQEEEEARRKQNKDVINKSNPVDPKRKEAQRQHPSERMLAPSGGLDLQTGNITDPQYEERQRLQQRKAQQEAGNDNSQAQQYQQQNQQEFKQEYESQYQKSMQQLQTGNGEGKRMMRNSGGSLDAKIGDSSSMDAKIGDSSSMDAKTDDAW